jgi:hypothetical protein
VPTHRQPVIAALLFASGCASPSSPPATPTSSDTFTQSSGRADILFLIDNSSSMTQEQGKIADQAGGLIARFSNIGTDFHIGVIDSDFGEGGAMHAYAGPAVDGCDGCTVLTSDVGCASPSVDTTEPDDALAVDCARALVFKKLVATGIDGPAFEREFDQVMAALGLAPWDGTAPAVAQPVPAANAGFLRSDSELYIVIASDEDEGDKGLEDPPVSYYADQLAILKGTHAHVIALAGYADDATVSLADVCTILDTTYDADAFNDDPRAPALLAQLQNFTDGCTDPSDTDGNGFAETGERYIDLACRTGGVLANLCDANYSDAFDAIANAASGLARSFTLGHAAATDALDCDGDGSATGPLDGPLCVTALGVLGDCESETAPHLVASNGNCGFSYDATSHQVRFDGGFVPAPGTDVVIRYAAAP